MNRQRYLKIFGGLLFAGIAAAQITAAISSANLYPLNPYRMFSTPWHNGAKMLELQISTASGKHLNVSEVLDIPFFQNHRILYNGFVAKHPIELESKLCQLLVARIGENLNVVAEGVRYERDHSGAMDRIIERQEIRGHCTKTSLPMESSL